ncbi:protein of unknown function [Methylocaldum szegediense]|uniref:Uncharacterized protein n=1 Tax=Methylocaldum szegediense TaxID=73780 RepID=A0ABM9HWM5_9GAMM|nr:protein of unknown function [Methylocaldum szegediense]
MRHCALFSSQLRFFEFKETFQQTLNTGRTSVKNTVKSRATKNILKNNRIRIAKLFDIREMTKYYGKSLICIKNVIDDFVPAALRRYCNIFYTYFDELATLIISRQ